MLRKATDFSNTHGQLPEIYYRDTVPRKIEKKNKTGKGHVPVKMNGTALCNIKLSRIKTDHRQGI